MTHFQKLFSILCCFILLIYIFCCVYYEFVHLLIISIGHIVHRSVSRFEKNIKPKLYPTFHLIANLIFYIYVLWCLHYQIWSHLMAFIVYSTILLILDYIQRFQQYRKIMIIKCIFQEIMKERSRTSLKRSYFQNLNTIQMKHNFQRQFKIEFYFIYKARETYHTCFDQFQDLIKRIDTCVSLHYESLCHIVIHSMLWIAIHIQGLIEAYYSSYGVILFIYCIVSSMCLFWIWWCRFCMTLSATSFVFHMLSYRVTGWMMAELISGQNNMFVSLYFGWYRLIWKTPKERQLLFMSKYCLQTSLIRSNDDWIKIYCLIGLSWNCYHNGQYLIGIRALKIANHISCQRRDGIMEYVERNHSVLLPKMMIKWKDLYCDYCKKKGKRKGLRTCCGCMQAVYCSRKCQKYAWKKEHRFICNKTWSDPEYIRKFKAISF